MKLSLADCPLLVFHCASPCTNSVVTMAPASIWSPISLSRTSFIGNSAICQFSEVVISLPRLPSLLLGCFNTITLDRCVIVYLLRYNSC